MTVTCSRCGAALEADYRLAGRVLPCPACGAELALPAASAVPEVIDVHAEVIGPDAGARSGGEAPGGRAQSVEGPWGRIRTYRFDFGPRPVNDPGCGRCGCLLLAAAVIVLWLALRGCVSLFA